MYKVKHSRIARFFYDLYIKREMKKHFSGYRLTAPLPEIPADYSLLVTPNHISWWDGFFIDQLFTRHYGKKLHLMMLEKELKKIKFFTKIGAYSITPESASSVIESIKYTREILNNSDNYCVIYPQGEIEPFEKEVLSVKTGIVKMLRTGSKTMVLPVSFKIQYENEKKPYIAVNFGKLLTADEVISDFNLYISEFHKTRNELNNFIFDKNIFHKISL